MKSLKERFTKPALTTVLFVFAYCLPWMHAGIVDATEEQHVIWGITAVLLTLAFTGLAFIWGMVLVYDAWRRGTKWAWQNNHELTRLQNKVAHLERRQRAANE